MLCTVAGVRLPAGQLQDLTGATEAIAAHDGDPRLIATVSVIIGIVLAAIILALTGYFTGTEDKPVQDVGKTSPTVPRPSSCPVSRSASSPPSTPRW